MAKKVSIISAIVVALLLVVLLVHPVKVLSGDSYRYQVFITGTSTKADSIAPMAGGLRVYLNEEDYVWLSDGEYAESETASPFGVRWNFFWQPVTIQYGRG